MPIHVVVCVDEPYLARMIACRLMRADFEVHSAHDCESAWDVINSVRPQLVITDLQYPGLGLICQIRNTPALSDLPAIVLSSNTGNPTALAALQQQLKLHAILPKPFSLRSLVKLATEATRPALARAV